MVDGDEVLIDLGDTALSAPHNRENLAAAVELCLRVLPAEAVLSPEFRLAVRTFHPGRHRLEAVHEAAGVRFVNDSKATNPASTVARAAVDAGNGRAVARRARQGDGFLPDRAVCGPHPLRRAVRRMPLEDRGRAAAVGSDGGLRHGFRPLRSGPPANTPGAATPCCSLRPVRAWTCSGTTRSAATGSRST